MGNNQSLSIDDLIRHKKKYNDEVSTAVCRVLPLNADDYIRLKRNNRNYEDLHNNKLHTNINDILKKYDLCKQNPPKKFCNGICKGHSSDCERQFEAELRQLALCYK